MPGFSHARPLSIARLLLLAALLMSSPAAAQAPGYAEIRSPVDGQAVQGLLTIEGSASHPFFEAYDLAFTYSENPTDTWFSIADTVADPVSDGPLALWDTTGLTDGTYRLRLRVFLSNGNVLQVFVENLRVRNYTPIEPAPVGTLQPESTPTAAPPTRTPRPTPLPVRTGDGGAVVLQAFSVGAIAGGAALLLLGAYLLARRRMEIRLGIMRTRRMLWQQDRQRRKRG